MELTLPMNYVELEQEEMMYLDGGGFGKNWWNSRNAIGTGIDIALLAFGIWASTGAAAKKWIANNTTRVFGAIAKFFNVSISMRKKIVQTISGLGGIAGLSVGYLVALGIDASDKWYGSFGVDGYCYA